MNSELKHHGVKGMRWGIRRRKKSKSKDISRMSNRELQEYIIRLNLEQQYSRLTTKPKSTVRKLAEDALREAVKENVKNRISKGISTSLDLGGKTIANTRVYKDSRERVSAAASKRVKKYLSE